jgi:aryl-alcohol dehydrogenase-like predicted oxidoreductase
VLAQRPWIVPIPGTTKLNRFEENMAAADLKLSDGDLGAIQAGLSQVQVEGERYPANLMAVVGR